MVTSTEAAPQKMRPYTGIGLLLLKINPGMASTVEPLFLYEQPGIFPSCEFNAAVTPPHDWIFGADATLLPLFVMSCKGGWLEVVYDDAGREAWLNPGKRGVFKSWQVFLKGKTGYLLPGLQKKHYQLLTHNLAGSGMPISSKEHFKIIRIQNNQALVMLDSQTLGWLSWRDEDGRLLLKIDTLDPL
jgi:hypothetical protein